jgi:hypothetical protein
MYCYFSVVDSDARDVVEVPEEIYRKWEGQLNQWYALQNELDEYLENKQRCKQL